MPTVPRPFARTAAVACAVGLALAVAAAPAEARVTDEGEHVALLRARVLERVNAGLEEEIERLREQCGTDEAVAVLEMRLRHGAELAEQLRRLAGRSARH